MESRASRLSFSLDALIAEAKRRARQRRVLVLLLLVAVVAVVAGVTFGSSGGGSHESGGPGQTGGRSDGSQSVQIGSFAVNVPRGFYWAGPLPHPNTPNLTISNLSSPLAPNRVELDIGYLTSAKNGLSRTSQLPLDLAKLHAMEPGRQWGGFVSGGGSVYSVHIYFGSKAPAGARASVLRALSSIHRAR
jgi:hypothetical protein